MGIERMKKTVLFKPIWVGLDAIVDPVNFIGRCAEQAVRFAENDFYVE